MKGTTSFSGASAIVTGATSGLGLELARLLHEAGARLLLSGRDADALSRLREEWGAEVLACDLTDRAQAEQLAAVAASGEWDLLVNCAGAGRVGDAGTEILRDLASLACNVAAVQLLTEAFLSGVTSGRILNVASTAAFAPSPLFASYAASKSFVYSYSRAVAEELRARGAGVRLTVFCPGPLATDFDRRAGAGARRGMDARRAARLALKGAARGRPVVVPGLGNKLLRLASRLAPDRLLVRLMRRIQSGKRPNV